MKKSIKKLLIALSCAVFAVFMAIGGVGCSKTVPQWIKEQQCGEHEWNEGEVTKETSCTAEGEMTYTCTECGKKDVQAIAQLPHTEVIVEMTESTCKAEGLTDGVKCDVCETWVIPQKVIPKKEHTVVIEAAVAKTCLTSGKTEGSYCSVCEEVFAVQEVIPATGHTVVKTDRVAATCTKDGVSAGQECSTCGEVFLAQEVIPATGHTPVTVKGKAATCTATGLTDSEKCTTCGEVLTEQTVIPALGHTSETIAGKAATCTAKGLTNGAKCSTCGEVLTAQAVIPALGHSKKTVAGKAATCTENGLTPGQECAICGVTLIAQEVIPATGHTPVTVAGKAATCTETGLTNGSKCSTCGEVLIAQEVISENVTGHTDENEDFVCEACGEELYYTLATYATETVEVGDNVGGWYRFSKDLVDGSSTLTFFDFALKNITVISNGYEYVNVAAQPSNAVMCMDGVPEYFLIENLYITVTDGETTSQQEFFSIYSDYLILVDNYYYFSIPKSFEADSIAGITATFDFEVSSIVEGKPIERVIMDS